MLEFAKLHLNHSESMKETILCSDETRIELLGRVPIVVSSESQVLATPIPMGKHGASTIFWEAFSAADAEKN